MPNSLRILTLSSLLGAIAFPVLADDGLAGKWMLHVTQGNSELIGLLNLRPTDAGYVAHVQGGPATVEIKGDRIEMWSDDRTGGGEVVIRYFTGRISGDAMAGEFGPPEGASEAAAIACRRYPLGCMQPTGSWRAERFVAAQTADLAPRPVDLSGDWAGRGGLGKWSMDLTPQGQAWKDEFDVELDLPSQRCASSGIVWGFGRGAEFFQSDDKITIVRGSTVRRVFMDRTSPPEFHPQTPQGYSIGRWEGSTLIVETTLMLSNVRGWQGEPISEDARVVERYWLNDDDTLSGDQTLYDPVNYREPPLKHFHYQRRKDSGATTVHSSCDPDSFFQQMYEDGKIEEYINRADRRY